MNLALELGESAADLRDDEFGCRSCHHSLLSAYGERYIRGTAT